MNNPFSSVDWSSPFTYDGVMIVIVILIWGVAMHWATKEKRK